MHVACCQIAPDVLAPANNVGLARDALAAAIDDGARIVVLPELVNSGYVFESRRRGARRGYDPRRRRAGRLGDRGGAQ